MNDQQRDELLVRLDERMDTLMKWVPAHELKHKEEKENSRKYFFVIYTTVVGILARLFFW